MFLGLRKVGLPTFLVGLLAASFAYADAALKPSQLVVVDHGNLFSENGIVRAKEEFARLKTKTGRQAMVVTTKQMPADEAEKYDKIDKKDKAALSRFWRDFAVSMAKTDQARGVYILICRHPGHVVVLADKEMRQKGFDNSKEQELSADLYKALTAAGKENTDADKTAAHDRALMNTARYMMKNLPSASADVKQPTRTTPKNDGKPAQAHGSGWGIGQWICLGVVVLAGIWIVFAIIRAFSGGGTSGPGGGGFGGGGGGFLSSMLGGLFGAAAGMWVYDQFFGGRSRGGDYYGGNADYGGGSVTDEGAGDFSGDTGADAGGSGDFGGDTGGDAGGDFGGDTGGGFDGGGDFGGGDFGGGGDSGGGDF